MQISTILRHEKDTKGTHFYATKSETAMIRSVYVQKGTFPDNKAPEVIEIRIIAED